MQLKQLIQVREGNRGVASTALNWDVNSRKDVLEEWEGGYRPEAEIERGTRRAVPLAHLPLPTHLSLPSPPISFPCTSSLQIQQKMQEQHNMQQQQNMMDMLTKLQAQNEQLLQILELKNPQLLKQQLTFKVKRSASGTSGRASGGPPGGPSGGISGGSPHEVLVHESAPASAIRTESDPVVRREDGGRLDSPGASKLTRSTKTSFGSLKSVLSGGMDNNTVPSPDGASGLPLTGAGSLKNASGSMGSGGSFDAHEGEREGEGEEHGRSRRRKAGPTRFKR